MECKLQLVEPVYNIVAELVESLLELYVDMELVVMLVNIQSIDMCHDGLLFDVAEAVEMVNISRRLLVVVLVEEVHIVRQ